MSKYWDPKFLSHLSHNINIIFEVGARYGDESIKLSEIFNNATIYSFECNPMTIDKCKQNLKDKDRILFFDHGLGDKNETLPFFSFTENNDGASSFLKRIDFDHTQKETGTVNIKKLINIVEENNINHIDLLCMDVQGYELNVLKGADDFIKNIKYIIMEEPKLIINSIYLGTNHSKYINAPTSEEIKIFMNNNNFFEIERIDENFIEDNVMYKNILYESS